jgi:hypothetical protein
MLCLRCEHRAKYLEAKLLKEVHCPQPRCECGDANMSVYTCYMYKPCLPTATAPAYKDDIRPRLGVPMISSRERFVRVLEEAVGTVIYDNGDEIAVGWKVKND